MSYRLVIKGFIQPGSATCPTTSAGYAINDTFVTAEGTSTYGCVYASWEQQRPVTIVKVAENNSNVTPAIPTFNYGVQVASGADFATPTDDWRAATGWNDFSLTPTAFGTAGSASFSNELLIPVDGVRVTEQIPAYNPDLGGWRLDDITCLTGTGAPVLTTAGTPVRTDVASGQADLANLALATAGGDAAAAARIICTYTSVYEPAAAISLIKKINGADANEAPGVLVEPGSSMIVDFEVTNTGEKALNNVTITDSVIDAANILAMPQKTNAAGDLVDWDGTLLPGETIVFRAEIPTPAIGGAHHNIGTVTATPVDTTSTVTDDDPAFASTGTPAITLVKTAALADSNGNGFADAGEVITYSFVVTNTGTLTLAPVTISDPKLGLTDAACVATLAPGASATCTTTGSYTVTAAANAGYVFADGTKVKNFGVAVDSGVVCPPTSVPVPAAPQPIDPCNVVGGGNNAYWPVPASTAEVTWSLTGGGELIATANAGYVFADGRTSINFGIAPDNGVVCPPVQVPVPAQPSHIEVCDTPGVTNNSIWVVPANTAQVTWTLLANGQLVSRTAAGYVFTNGSTEINWGIAPDNGWSCVPGTA